MKSLITYIHCAVFAVFPALVPTPKSKEPTVQQELTAKIATQEQRLYKAEMAAIEAEAERTKQDKILMDLCNLQASWTGDEL